MSIVPVFPYMQERFGTNSAGVGILFGAYVFGYAMFQLLVGPLSKRWNQRQLILLGLFLSTFFSIGFGLAPDFGTALLARFLLGGSGALLYTPSFTAVIALFEPLKRGSVMGVLQSGAGVGAAGALIFVPIAFAHGGNVAGLFLLPTLTATVFVFSLRLFPEVPQCPMATAAALERNPNIGRQRAFWQLLSISGIGMFATYGLLTWLPLFLTQTFGYSSVRAGAVASIPTLAIILSSPIIGRLADLKRGRTRVVAAGSGLALVSYLLLIPPQSAALVGVLSALIGVSLAATTAPLMLLAAEHFRADQVTVMIAHMATAGQIGATLSGVVLGFILTYTGGFVYIWLACALLCFLRLAVLTSFFRLDSLRRNA